MAAHQVSPVDYPVYDDNTDVDDWQGAKSVLDSNRYMLDNQIDCDIFFLCGDKKESVGGHKYVLTSRSSVFYAMFRGPLAESSSEIPIPDIEIDIFRSVLAFLYCEEASFEANTVIALLYAAKKYNIRRLVKRCVDYLESSVDVDNACLILEQAHHFHENGLYKKILGFIFDAAEAVLMTSELSDLCPECLASIVKSDELRVNDKTVLKACLAWADMECSRRNLYGCDENKRVVLGDMIYHIRFPLLDPEFFVDELSGSKLLTEEEKVQILCRFIKDLSPIDNFCDRQRKKLELWRPVRFFTTDSNLWQCESGADAISFCTTGGSLLHGFLVYRARRTSGSLPSLNIKATLFNADDGHILHKHSGVLDTDKSPDVCDVFFSSSVRLHKECSYTLEVTIRGTGSIFGRRGKQKVSGKCNEVMFKDSELSTTGTSIHSGQIPGLILSALTV